MTGIRNWMSEPLVKAAVRFLQAVCWFVIAFYVLCLALSVAGRQTFVLHTSQGTYDRAIYAEEDHDQASRSFTVSTTDQVYVRANDRGGVDPATQAGMSLMYVVHALPLIGAYWLLSRVLGNLLAGRIFVEQNAFYLLCFGLIQCSVALAVPVAKILICAVSNLFAQSQVSVSTGQNVFSGLVTGVAFVVAAYILRYGIGLQDEVDHTL